MQKLEAAVTSKTASVAINVTSILANMSPIPGPGAVPQVLKGIQNSVKAAKARRDECASLARLCEQLVAVFEKQNLEGLKGTGLYAPVSETIAVLEQAREVLTDLAATSRMQAIVNDGHIKSKLEKSTKAVEAALAKFSIEGRLVIAHQVEVITANQKEVTSNLKDIQYVLETAHSGKLAALPGDKLADLTETANENLHKLQDIKDLHDSKLQIGGVRMTRSQFNVVYQDLMQILSQLEEQFGQRPQVLDLKQSVVIEDSYARDGGDFTDIYYGKYLQTTPVAVKVMRGLRSSFERAKKRLLNEVKVWSILEHPHIHTFIGVTQFRGSLALVSPWRKEGNIRYYISQRRDENRFKLLAGAAEGLQYLHEHNIAHSNIKGSNILISDDGEALVADFQMAKLMRNIAEDANLQVATLTRQPSPRWLAPELMDQSVTPNTKSDVWSFGMLILEVCTGDVPFAPWKRNEQVMYQVSVNGLRPARPENNDWVTDGVWELMQQCWREPDARPAIMEVHERLLVFADEYDLRPKPEPSQHLFDVY